MTALLPGDWGSRVAYSSKLNYQYYVDDLDELYEQAEAVLAGFRVKIESISSKGDSSKI